MPRRAKPPRLWLEEREGRESKWIILDSGRKISTGIDRADAEGAARALEAYISEKYEPSGSSNPASVSIAEVLENYLRLHVPNLGEQANPRRHVRDLVEWWAGKTVADVKGKSCREYFEWRKTRAAYGAKGDTTASRDLATLRAAIRLWHKEHTLSMVPVVSIPEPSDPRDEWLTRDQVAHLLRVVRKRPKSAHLARLILIGVYSGTRSGAVLGLRWMPSTDGGWVDLEHDLMYRRGRGKSETKKRTPPVRIHARLLPHLRRWRDEDVARGITHVIHFNQGPVKKLRRSWDSAREIAGFDQHFVLHSFRHTATTWMLQAGVPIWEVSGYVGMSVKTIEKVYGHHCPDYQNKAASAIAPKRVPRRSFARMIGE